MIHAIELAVRTALLPLLLVQALWSRHKALRLPEPPGPREGITGSGPPLRLLILGDSSAAGVGTAHQDEALAGRLTAALGEDFTVHWQLLAKTGATTADALRWLDTPGGRQVDIAVTALGVNDVTGLVPLELWLARQNRLFAHLHEQSGARHIFASGLPPMGHFPLLPQPLRWVLGRQASRFDRYLGKLANGSETVTHVPLTIDMKLSQMAPDGYHPGPEITAAWASHLASEIIGWAGKSLDRPGENGNAECH